MARSPRPPGLLHPRRPGGSATVLLAPPENGGSGGVGAVGGGLVGDNIDEKREKSEKHDLERQLELERQKAPQGQNKIDAHYEYIKNLLGNK